ncbi:hypothetical protein ALC56_04574, partial [Trachymyrmex septentrionalis]
SRRATWNDCGVASWNGIRDVQEKRTRDKRKRRGARLVPSQREREREREMVFSSVHHHYGNLVRVRNVGLRYTRIYRASTAGVNRPPVTYTGTPTGRAAVYGGTQAGRGDAGL